MATSAHASLSDGLLQQGIQRRYVQVLMELSSGLEDYLLEIEPEDLRGLEDAEGRSITGPVAHGLVKKLRRLPSAHSAAAPAFARTGPTVSSAAVSSSSSTVEPRGARKAAGPLQLPPLGAPAQRRASAAGLAARAALVAARAALASAYEEAAVREQLRQMGFSQDRVRRARATPAGRQGTLEAAVEALLALPEEPPAIAGSEAFSGGRQAQPEEEGAGPAGRAPPAAWECQICFAEQEAEGWRCPDGHRYCADCMRRHVDSVPFPCCPTPGCGVELEEEDLLVLGVAAERVEAFRDARLSNAVDALGSGAGGAASTGPASAAGGSGSGAGLEVVVRCPNPGCRNAVVAAAGERRRYRCGCGTEPFCTLCRQAPYHFQAECSEVQPLRERWLEWISGGRDEYHGRVRASADSEAQVRALREALSRHEELEADEQWKAKHCRLCPQCRRPVQKLEGCDSMVCGSDAHGGNDQPGCGHAFSWTAAPAYRARVESRELPRVSGEETRCRGKGAFHAFADCSLCEDGGHGILGPRFRCVHCENFSVCLACEPLLAVLHDPGHVFQILTESDNGWSGLRLPRGTRVRVVQRGGRAPADLSDPDSARPLEGLCGFVRGHEKGDRTGVVHPRAFQWQDNRGRWHAYASEPNARLSEAASRGRTTVRLEMGGLRYTVDLRRLQQRNETTGRIRPVRDAALEVEGAARSGGRAGTAVQVDRWSHGSFRPTRLCRYFQSGGCWHGDACRFAHGSRELQPAPAAGTGAARADAAVRHRVVLDEGG